MTKPRMEKYKYYENRLFKDLLEAKQNGGSTLVIAKGINDHYVLVVQDEQKRVYFSYAVGEENAETLFYVLHFAETQFNVVVDFDFLNFIDN